MRYFVNALQLITLIILSTAAEGSQNLIKVKIELKWFHQFQFAGIYMAKEKGFYKEVGLDVEIIERNIKSNPVKDVLNKEVQYGITDATIIRQRLEGKPLIILAAIYQHSPLVLISLADKNLYSPLELRNKKVMYQNGVDDAIMVGMFTNQGLDRKDFKFVPHTFKNDALLTGYADAMSAYMGNQTYFYKKLGHRLNIINPANYGLDFYGDMLFTSEEYFLKHKAQSLAFKQATIKGWKYALEHPEEAVDLILAKYSTKKTRDALLHESKYTRSMIAHNLIELGEVNRYRIERIQDIYKHWSPELKDQNIDGILYSDHLRKPSDDDFYIISLIAIVATTVAAFSTYFARRWRKREQFISSKFSKTSKKLESFQDVILHKFDTTRTNELSEITFISDTMLENLGYERNELIGHKKTELYSTDNPDKIHQLIRNSIAKHGLWQGELKLKAKNGDNRVYDCLVDEYIDGSGNHQGYISVHIDQTDKKRAEKLATTDGLTSIANRYFLDQKLHDETKRANRTQLDLSVILFDIDHFKQFNDGFGHNAGDEVLKHVARTLKNTVRDIDIVGRWGGEEFLVICLETPQEGALVLANKLREAVADLMIPNLPGIEISGGVVSFRGTEDVFSLIERADKGLYEAKKRGRNQIIVSQ